MISAKDRKTAERERMTKLGFKRFEAFVHKLDWDRVREFVDKLKQARVR